MKLPEDVNEVTELLLNRTVTRVDTETLVLDDGQVLKVRGNDGCGGCSAGNYEVTALNDCPVNAIMDVQLVEETDPQNELTTYRLFVLAQDERIELVTCEGSDGNGLYGTGFWVEVER